MNHSKILHIITSLERAVFGKNTQVRLSLACLLARGHLLLEDLPGMGKTTLAHALAKVLGLDYQRIQFTSDLLPGDILGGAIFNPETQKFALHKGPIFTELLLADEINRTTPKSQSALLEAMGERQVTINRTTHKLPQHFFVIATQNPNTTGSGTYPLPESQLDRFLMCISLGYPSTEAELKILKGENIHADSAALTALVTREELTVIQQTIDKIHASDAILQYILRIAEVTRSESRFTIGISPRGSVALLAAARAFAFIEGRDYVIPEDIKAVLPSVCAHRLRDTSHLSGKKANDLTSWLLQNVPSI